MLGVAIASVGDVDAFDIAAYTFAVSLMPVDVIVAVGVVDAPYAVVYDFG